MLSNPDDQPESAWFSILMRRASSAKLAAENISASATAPKASGNTGLANAILHQHTDLVMEA